MKTSAPLSQSEQRFMSQARSGVSGYNWYTASGALFIQVYAIFFVTIRGLSILFFLDFGYSVHGHELNVYFSVEAALLAG